MVDRAGMIYVPLYIAALIWTRVSRVFGIHGTFNCDEEKVVLKNLSTGSVGTVFGNRLFAIQKIFVCRICQTCEVCQSVKLK